MKPLFLYNSLLMDVFGGRINFEDVKFKAMLVDDTYRPDQRADARRSNVTGEVKGLGYPEGGVDVSASAAFASDNILEITCGEVKIPKATLTARGVVYYVDRGGAAEDDELVAFVDFGEDVTSTNGPYIADANVFTFEN
jgi:hypothetical protein